MDLKIGLDKETTVDGDSADPNRGNKMPLSRTQSAPPSPIPSALRPLRSASPSFRLVKDTLQPSRGSLRTLHEPRDEDDDEEDDDVFPSLPPLRPRANTCPEALARWRAKKKRDLRGRPPSPPIPRSPARSWSREQLELTSLREDT